MKGEPLTREEDLCFKNPLSNLAVLKISSILLVPSGCAVCLCVYTVHMYRTYQDHVRSYVLVCLHVLRVTDLIWVCQERAQEKCGAFF